MTPAQFSTLWVDGVWLVPAAVLAAVGILFWRRSARKIWRQGLIDVIEDHVLREFNAQTDALNPNDPARRPLWVIKWLHTMRSPSIGKHWWAISFQVALDEPERHRRAFGVKPYRHLVRSITIEFNDRWSSLEAMDEADQVAAAWHQQFTDYVWGARVNPPAPYARRLSQRESRA